MQKVFVVRDFPFACGPHFTLMNVHGKEAQGGGLNPVGDCKDVDHRVEGDVPRVVEGEGYVGVVVESQSEDTIGCSKSTRKVKYSLAKCENMKNESEDSDDDLPLVLRSSRLQNDLMNKEPVSIYKIHDKSKVLMGERAGLLSAFKNVGPVEIEKAPNDSDSERIDGISAQLHLVPHHPIPSCLVGRERKYPPQKAVFAVRDFPFGCGCNVQQFGEFEDKHLGQIDAYASSPKDNVRNDEHRVGVKFDADIASKEGKGIIFGKIDDTHEGQSAEGARGGVMITVSQCDKKIWGKGQAQDSELQSNKQCGGLIEKAGYCGEDKGKVQHDKETLVVASCSNIDSQDKMPCVQNENKRVTVLGLMSAPNCPSKQEVKFSRSPLMQSERKGKHESMLNEINLSVHLIKVKTKPYIWEQIRMNFHVFPRMRRIPLKTRVVVWMIYPEEKKHPICAVNTVDEEKPPSFTYITSMMYPDWCQTIPPRGCDCKGDCSNSKHCACAIQNGGEIPYNHDGAIVEPKPLVYECGPSCKCRSTCYNRVSQYGIKFPLEIFKTESRGWGVRCLSSIPSGGFICGYIGELLDDNEAEQRTGSDEYLFDIGRNYKDVPSSSIDAVANIGFTIDAATYGNIGRFINHCCSPNLYAQFVVYDHDHDEKRIPHNVVCNRKYSSSTGADL